MGGVSLTSLQHCRQEQGPSRALVKPPPPSLAGIANVKPLWKVGWEMAVLSSRVLRESHLSEHCLGTVGISPYSALCLIS